MGRDRLLTSPGAPMSYHAAGLGKGDAMPGKATAEWRIEQVDQGRWPDLCRLFESRGGPHYCWCMAWRDMPAKARSDKAAKKAALRERVEAGMPIGLLGYLDGTPVAWCSVGPRSSFRRLSKQAGAEEGSVWSITCFFITRAHRGKGLSSRLIDGAVACARRNGADIVEAYPVAPYAPSYRFMGLVPQFERAGFVHAGTSGKWRQVMRLHLQLR